ncbi:TBCC domain-containing protein 1 [Platysternon megacephalum]|uniref:TBCC domain-containing protein 1 n=1 Tax=Platysternon megacephalum TaxID=55544 RepID=A0A4D9EWU6_9SAUR|nr:TBCC domain-containing protein 1 [Platysternon megacephalum]
MGLHILRFMDHVKFLLSLKRLHSLWELDCGLASVSTQGSRWVFVLPAPYCSYITAIFSLNANGQELSESGQRCIFAFPPQPHPNLPMCQLAQLCQQAKGCILHKV